MIKRTAPPAPSSALRHEPLRILVVEDSPTQLLLLRETFTHMPAAFEVKEAARLSEAVRRLQRQCFDIVLADLGLPDSDGLETLRGLMKHVRGTPIVILTSLDDEEVADSAIRAGAQEYLLKQEISRASLARLIRHVFERRRLERELQQAQKLEAVGRLAGGVAHDFNNLLVVIEGHAAVLQRPDVPQAQIKASAEQIQKTARRAAVLTRQLLTFSRHQTTDPRVVHLNAVIRQTSDMLHRLLGANVELELKLEPELPPVFADVGMLEQIIVNLAVNARDAMPNGGRLTIRTSLPALEDETSLFECQKYICMEVEDTGSGIPGDVLPQVFEPFFSTKEAGKGTGLGLATVFGIVRQHSGHIDVASEVGKGTLFRITLPATDQPLEPAGEHEEEQAEAGAVAHDETILVAEDDPSVASLVTMILQQLGYQVILASTGKEAWQLWQEREPEIDLLITDLIMPGSLSGRDLAKRARAKRPDLGVIFMSGHTPDFLAPENALAERELFLMKPFTMKELAEAVRGCLAA